MEWSSRRIKISPLIIAIIFITFFQNVLSRHRIRHYKDRFKRQQGANLYLPGSFVTDNDDAESGSWEEWSAPGPCSRTCGGGVSAQSRRCFDGYVCTGPTTRYFSCNTQDCPDVADYRAQQCAEHDNIAFEGEKYQWIPYTKGPISCELNCMPKGERFYYRHADAVVDGTRCTDEGYDVCVRGTCQHVGCDRMLGSLAKEDQCRVCQGDGSTCNTFTKTISMKDMQAGYNDILLIPAGATNIRVEEMAQSGNYLAVRNTNGQYYLNGNWRIDFPRSTDFAGTRFKYERFPQEFDAPDIITSLGPTDESLFIVLLYQGADVPVQYSYSLPTMIPVPTNETYSWLYDGYTPCSVSCGRGVQYRNVSCAGRNTLETVADSLCDSNNKPESERTCSESECSPEWTTGDWSECSELCGGKEGIQTREVACRNVDDNGEPYDVDFKKCSVTVPVPSTQKTCKVDKRCPKWFLEPWKPCDHLCGEGKQTRKITCYVEDDDGKKKILPDEECAAVEKRPPNEQSCNLRPCEGVDWIVSEWSGCIACGLTQETRQVLCATEDEQIQDDKLCDADRKPEILRKCESNPCQYLWYASQWSECSASCGPGLQSRTVFCGIFTTNGIEKVDRSKCDESKHFETSRNCTGEVETCEGEWYSGPMGECSKSCGGGQRSKKVVCVRDFQVVDPNACGASKIVFSEENCNEQPCSEDTLMPTDITQAIDESEPTKDWSKKREATTPTGADSGYEEVTTQPYETVENSDEFEIVLATSCDDGEWIEEDDGNTMQGDDPFAYQDLMMGDQPFDPLDGSGDATDSTDPSYSLVYSTYFPETTDLTDITTEFTGLTQLSGKTTDFTGASEITTESTESTDASEITTESTESTDASENSTELSGSTGLSESTTEITGSTGTSEINTESTGSTDASESYTELTGSTSASEITTESAGSSGASESTTELTGSSSASAITTESTGLTGASESTTELTEPFSAFESTTESTGSTGASEMTTESTGLTDTSVITTISNGSTGASDSTTELTGSTSASDITTESAGSSGASESTTELTGSSSASDSTTESTGSTGASEITIELTETSGTSESTTEITGSTSAYEITTESTGSTGASESTSELTGSSSAFESTTELTGSSGTSESTTESTGSSGTSESTTEITGSTSASEITTEFTGSTGSSESSTELTGSTSASESTTELTGSSGTSESNTELTGSTSASEMTTESTGASEITTDFTESSGASESITDITGSTSASEITTEFTESTTASEITTESTGPTGASESTTELTGSTGASEMTTEITGSPGASESTTELTGSSGTESTTETTGSTSASEMTTESTELTSASEITTEFTGSTGASELTTESTETTGGFESTTELTGSTDTSVITTEFGGSTSPAESTSELIGSTGASENTTEFAESAESTTSILEIFTLKPRMCKRRKIKKCKKSPFGCCWDNITTAKGPFDEGCPTPHTCKESKFGCCDDGVSAALGPENAGCPPSQCKETLFGCCRDNKTASQGNYYEGCPPACLSSRFGCCDDNVTQAIGPHHTGCPEDTTTTELTTEVTETTPEATTEITSGSTTISPETESIITIIEETTTVLSKDCNNTSYRCCPDQVTAATGPGFQGCGLPCSDNIFGCCPDAKTPAHGPTGEGCCLAFQFGCCPDDITPARGPNKEGCDCQFSPYGCCPDNETAAEGYDNEGCGCQYTDNGCCPDGFTRATGPDFAGCLCHTFQFGCCPDGINAAEGPRGQGCGCMNTEFSCCSDNKTPASGPNMEGCTCENTKYGCCMDGVTEAKGDNFEGCRDVPQNLQAGCSLNKEKGTCRNYTVKWFYDMGYGGCSRFWYGGCDGNANRYKSKEECEDICVQPPGPDRCKLPKVTGPCEGYYLRWYYDVNIKACTQFVYGGCLGNNNRFETKEECQNICAQDSNPDPCQQKREEGPCQGRFQRFYYDADLAQCQEFVYGGCKGNDNNFLTVESCKQQCAPSGERKDFCSLPHSEGNCTEVLPNWFYDTSRKDCSPFYYTGCYGNLNNFETREACRNDCPAEFEKDACQLPADTGDCDNYVDRWYYDTKFQVCRQFYYGGCGGNENNFLTQHRCQERCDKKQSTTPLPKISTQQPATFTPDMCLLPKETGPCRAAFTKYFFDVSDGVCKEFTYGGCDGNGNNFESIEDCLRKCGNARDLCELPPVRGPCGGDYPQYYYESSTDSCRQFSFGGCGGNYNRFQDESSCERRCKKSVTSPLLPTTGSEPYMCFEDPHPGNCTDRYTAFYYNRKHGMCKQFFYSGCGGNSNRFNSEEQCQRQCGDFRGQDVCNMERDPGPCRGYFIKYYYDRSTGRCEQFAYGGCEGNGNRFSSQDECAQICITHEESKPNMTANALCRLPVSQGSCNDNTHKRWYFDDEKGDCAAFIFTGCGGNFNNFKSYQSCLDYCKDLLVVTEPKIFTTTYAPQHPCQEVFDECATIRCAYGIEPYVDENECNRCKCRDPCAAVNCQQDEQCAIDINRNKVSAQDADFIAVCRKQLKPGTCPQLEITDNHCEEECRTDADCALQMKCCSTGCGTACVDTPPGQMVTQYQPVYTETTLATEYQPPHVDVAEYKPEVNGLIGDQATLRCAVSGNPNPTIRWSKDNILIDGTQPRYRIKLDQSLQIITLHKTDSGIYLCTAHNGVGQSITNQVKLEVIDSEPRPATMLEPDDEQPLVVSLNAPTTLNCFVLGHPFPTVTWWKEESMIPFDDSEFEIKKDYSLLIHSVRLRNLGIYTCQAYNGFGKAASWSVTVKARGPITFTNPDDLKYNKWIVNQQEENVPVTTTTTTAVTRIITKPPEQHTYRTPYYNPYLTPFTEPSNEIIPDSQGGRHHPSVSVPVRANITSNYQRFPLNLDIEIPCEIGGYPTPQVQWYKDGVPLYESEKVHIIENERSSNLTIKEATQADAGSYQCEATNAYSKASSSLIISVEGMYVDPNCTDNPFFANCSLIVKAKYCSHKYYAKFCCRSCAKAGMLPDHLRNRKKKRHNFVRNDLV